MFKLMIADDNPFVLRELCNFFDWEDFGLFNAGSFSNGSTLLEAASENMPDVILTDVHMPVMDGISLASAIRKLSSDVKIVFVSSYADFEYAKEALSLHVSDYILKPFDEQQLLGVMKKVIGELRQERSRKFEVNRVMHQVETLRSIALENYMSKLLFHVNEDSLVREQLLELQLPLCSDFRIQVASISLCSSNNSTFPYTNETINQIRSILYNEPKEEYQYVLLPVDSKNLALLLILAPTCTDTADLLAQLCVDIETMSGFQTIIGFSQMSKSFAKLPDLYEQAISSKGSHSYAPVISYEEVQTEKLPHKTLSSTSKGHVRKMKEYIQTHFTEPITTNDVASAAFLSPSYANHCFNTECRCTIFDYITQQRINEARHLLEDTDEPINLISEMVGYSGKTNFYLAFKKNVGMSPAQYRRNYKG